MTTFAFLRFDPLRTSLAPDHRMRSIVFAVACLAGLSSAVVNRIDSAADRPTTLHPAVRSVIDTKMEAHAIEMTDLVMLVVLLERDDAAAAAERIASEPRIARPLELRDANAGIPDAFFVYQNDLARSAKNLAEASRTGSDQDIALAFGDLTMSCVACHSRFLEAE